MDITKVNKVIAEDVAKLNLGKDIFHKGKVTIGGKIIQYTAFGLGNNKVNVGTYFPL